MNALCWSQKIVADLYPKYYLKAYLERCLFYDQVISKCSSI